MKRHGTEGSGAGWRRLRPVLLAPAGAWVFAAACAAVFEAPDVRVAGVRVASLGLTEGTAAVDLEVTNPNRRALEVRGVEYRLRIEDPGDESGWITLGEGFHDRDVTIGPGDTTRVEVTVPFGYEAIEVAARSLFRNGTLGYRLDGEIRVRGPVGDLRVPVDHRGSFGPSRRRDVQRPGPERRPRPEVRGARARTHPVRSEATGVGSGAGAPKSNSTTDDSFRHS